MLFLACVLAAQAAPPPDPPVLERRHVIALELTLVDGDVTEGGEPIVLMTEPEGYRLLREAAWRDEPAADPVEGFHNHFYRHFDLITGGLAGAGEDDPSWESGLENRVVEFSRGESAGDVDWSVDWAPGEDGDDGLLAGLAPDGHLALLAPPEGAGPDETWRVDLSSGAPLLAPLGELSLGAGERTTWLGGGLTGFTLPPPPPLGPIWFTDLPVTGEARWIETFERDGRRIARVELALRAAGTVDTRAHCEALARESGLSFDVERYALAPELELEGELEWDIGAWRPARLALEGDAALDLEVHWTATSPTGAAHTLSSEQRLEGRVNVEASCAPR